MYFSPSREGLFCVSFRNCHAGLRKSYLGPADEMIGIVVLAYFGAVVDLDQEVFGKASCCERSSGQDEITPVPSITPGSAGAADEKSDIFHQFSR